jgi:L-alanine-DL-glutamate epimerase-like enolase superfamily enzyme
MKITGLTTEIKRILLAGAERIPLTDPKPTAVAIDLVVVQLETDSNLTGLGYTYLNGPGASAVRELISNQLWHLALGEDPREAERLFAKVEAKFRPVGFAGLAARAWSAIDIALWDIKAKAAGLPLFRLLGNAKPSAPFFASDIATLGRTSSEVVKLGKPLMKQGAMGVRVEVGTGDVRADADRVREISDGLGDDASVSVAADGRFDLGTAEALTHFFEDIGVSWFEDPIPTSDDIGYAKLANLAEIPLAIGAGFDSRERFFRTIRTGVVRTVRPDITRIGGITPFLKIAAVAEAYQTSVSPVRMTEIGVHLACGLPAVPHVDSVSWFKDAFTGGPMITDGKLVPSTEPGHGLKLNS